METNGLTRIHRRAPLYFPGELGPVPDLDQVDPLMPWPGGRFGASPRFIQKWGQVKDCCGGTQTCNPCGDGTLPNPGDYPGVWATFTLVDNAFCTSCNDFNGSYWLPLVDIGPWDCPVGAGLDCAFQYGDEFDVSLCGFGPPLYIWAIISKTAHGVYVSHNQLFNCSYTPNVIGYGFSSSGCVKIQTSNDVVGRCSGGVVVG